MSNHFTYEIDERNIRMQLKGYTIDAKEEDWQRFSGRLSDTSQSSQGTKLASKFTVTLNRNIVLPAVFGIIILVFTLLLVNFISIKNPAKPNTQSLSEEKNTPSPEQLVKTPTTQKEELPEIKSNEPLMVATEPVPPSDAVIQNAVSESKDKNNAAPEQQKADIANHPTAETSTLAVGESNPVAETNPAELTKKKRKKRILETVNAETSPELRPTLVSEDREPEVVPE